MSYAVELLNIVKRYPGVIANDDASVRIERGSIHAIVGENGAGKSTLMGVLYGLTIPDSGQIKLAGQPVQISDPQAAIVLNIGMVHQHFMLAPSLTALENIVIGRCPTRFGLVSFGAAERRVKDINSRFGLAVDLRVKVHQLSVGEMQRVEILKALYRGAEILILDEPTAVLTPQETADLFAVLRTLTEQGRTIIFISHKLQEVLAISDRITVMRGGRVSGEVATDSTNEHQLARMMVGRDVVLRIAKPPPKILDAALTVTQLKVKDDRGLTAVRSIDFCVKRGEIVGIAGVEGNGQSELIEALLGLRPSVAGSIKLLNQDITQLSTRQRRALGLGCVPQDRLKTGADARSSVADNLILNRYYQTPFSRWRVFNQAAVAGFAQQLVERFNIAASDISMPLSGLSGGNMQKVVLARELESEPELLLAAHPTRGVDIGAIEYIHKTLIELRDQGHGILLVSAELEEILTLSDRILVMYEGCLVGELAALEASEQTLGLLMSGAHGELVVG